MNLNRVLDLMKGIYLVTASIWFLKFILKYKAELYLNQTFNHHGM